MNKIIENRKEINCKKYKLKDLLIKDDTGPTAFIGRCGYGPSNSLYFITYNAIVLARSPSSIWDVSECSVEVKQFVDIEIKVINSEYPTNT